jgi:hypothetical protein
LLTSYGGRSAVSNPSGPVRRLSSIITPSRRREAGVVDLGSVFAMMGIDMSTMVDIDMSGMVNIDMFAMVRRQYAG